LLATVVATSWLAFSTVQAAESQAAKIKRLQAEHRIAEANAWAALETQRAYEEAWRKTKSAAKGCGVRCWRIVRGTGCRCGMLRLQHLQE
jgi:uncharacterized membrane protein YqiK